MEKPCRGLAAAFSQPQETLISGRNPACLGETLLAGRKPFQPELQTAFWPLLPPSPSTSASLGWAAQILANKQDARKAMVPGILADMLDTVRIQSALQARLEGRGQRYEGPRTEVWGSADRGMGVRGQRYVGPRTKVWGSADKGMGV